jgi:predicted alpha-1,6-mannanase (GH76 family)
VIAIVARPLQSHLSMLKRIISLALLACACSAEATGSDEDALASATRADKATAALINHFWHAGNFDATSNTSGAAGYWIYAEAFDAVLDAVQRTGGTEDAKYIDAIYSAQNARGWTRDFFDDECWMALALVRAYDVTKNAKYLSRAESLFSDIDSNGRTSSGIWWNRQHTQKATASNFGPAILAARLNERTGNPAYKTAAIQIYDYWYNTMVNHATYQVADHRDANGNVAWWKFTYDTGLAIGASIELWKITSNAGYLSHAHGFAGYMIANEVAPTQYGNVLHDGNCSGDCHMFEGIAFRFLAKLWTEDKSKTAYYDVLKASVRAIWYDARSTQTDLFSPDWAGPPLPVTTLAAQASATIALNIAAEDGI